MKLTIDLPTLATRPTPKLQKGKTRLELTVDQRALTKIDDKAFRAEVWKRDQHRCRRCERKVEQTLSRVPERGEVNHIHGRTGDLRFEPRAALLMCLTCHERFTGKVNQHKLVIIASKTFTIRQGTFTDARFPVTFQEVG